MSLPIVDKLVCGGDAFEGFALFLQGENYGPHQDAKCYKYVVNFFKETGGCGNLRDLRCHI